MESPKPNRRTASARAPGRLDVMGGIADYCGSLVLQLPLAVSTRATVTSSGDSRHKIVSEASVQGDRRRSFSMSVKEAREVLGSYDSARSYFADRPDDHWASYVLGCLTSLMVEEGIPMPPGLSVHIASNVPEGKGVSSSAALEVSAMGAVVALLGVDLSPERIARLCQLVENRVAGAPCGIMDQMTSACGKKNHLLSLLCQPAKLLGHLALPREIAVWGIDSGIRHSVGGSDYGTVRTATAMGYRILADREALPVKPTGEGRVSITDDRFHGYLSNLGSDLLRKHLPHLPSHMRGSDFLRTFGGIVDETVSVQPDGSYPVRAATTHPVYEHERSGRFASFLNRAMGEKTLAMMGELMYLSHGSYSACGLGSDGTDRIVELVKEEGYRSGLFGARITGGGSGGTVAILARADASDAVRRIAERYQRESGHAATIFEGSSSGLAADLKLET